MFIADILISYDYLLRDCLVGFLYASYTNYFHTQSFRSNENFTNDSKKKTIEDSQNLKYNIEKLSFETFRQIHIFKYFIISFINDFLQNHRALYTILFESYHSIQSNSYIISSTCSAKFYPQNHIMIGVSIFCIGNYFTV